MLAWHKKGRFCGKLAFLAVIFFILFYSMAQWVFEHGKGVDFYQYWGIGHGREFSYGLLKTPYVDMPRYGLILDNYTIASDDMLLHAANDINHKYFFDGLDPTNTPLLYAAFSFLPVDYTSAFHTFLTANVVLLAASLIMLVFYTRLYKKIDGLPLIVLWIMLGGSYWPLLGSLRDGNLDVFQLFSLTALTIFLDRNVRHCSARLVYIYGALLMSALVALVLLKPNTLVAAMLLAASFAALRGIKAFAFSTVAASCVGALLFALSCWHFGSPSAWKDWFQYFPNPSKVPFLVESPANNSLTLLISRALNADIYVVMGAVFAFLAIQISWLICKAIPRNLRNGENTWGLVIFLLKDPYLCVSIGIILGLAVPSLVWYRYYLLSVLVAFWLMAISPRWGLRSFLAAASIVISASFLFDPFSFSSKAEIKRLVASCAWIPLWIGALLVVKDRCRGYFRVSLSKKERSCE